MTLCANRFPLSGSPSTCALDTSIVIFPSILVIPALVLLFLFRKKFQVTLYVAVLPKWIQISYLVLIVCAFGMRVLEITRLVIAGQGVGLLPLGVISIILVFAAIIWKGRQRGRPLSLIILVYWLLSAITEIVKVVRLEQLLQVDDAKGSGYPTSDWLLDNAVLLGLLVLFTILEGVHWYKASKAPRDPPFSSPVEMKEPLFTAE